MPELNNIKEALDYAINVIIHNEHILSIKHFDRQFGLAGAIVITEKRRYFISFQKQLFNRYQWEEKGIIQHSAGIGLSPEDLDECKRNNYLPMKIFDEKLYVYEVKDWIAWDEAHKESRHSVRKQEDRKVPTDKWAYYNILSN